jgi:chorismate mutase/prephenate dehydratase
MNVEDWRSKIDAIDSALLHLLNLRTVYAVEIGRLKSNEGSQIRVPAREQDILKRMKSVNPGPLDEESIEKIYQLIFDESKRMQDLHCGVKKADGNGESAPSKARKTKQ